MLLYDYVKKLIWWLIVPFFPLFRNLAIKLGYSPYEERQPYHLGYLTANHTVKEFEEHLKNQGFNKDKIAWIDRGEVFSLRLRDGFRYQYHVRLFFDGEIRGHYELTPEFSPLGHLWDKDTSECKEDFGRMLGKWLSEAKPPQGK